MPFLSTSLCPKAQRQDKESGANGVEAPGGAVTELRLFSALFVHSGLGDEQHSPPTAAIVSGALEETAKC